MLCILKQAGHIQQWIARVFFNKSAEDFLQSTSSHLGLHTNHGYLNVKLNILDITLVAIRLESNGFIIKNHQNYI